MFQKLGHAHEAPAQPSALPTTASVETQCPGPRWPPLLQPRKARTPSPRKTQNHLMTMGPSTRNPLTPRGSHRPPPLTSPRRVVAAAGKPRRWPTHPGNSTASGPGTGNRKVLGGQPCHCLRGAQVRSGSCHPRGHLEVCHSLSPRTRLQHHTWKFSRMSFMLPLTNNSRGSFSKGGPPT